MKVQLSSITLLLGVLLTGCMNDELPPPPQDKPIPAVSAAAVPAPETKESPAYAYAGDRHRDPFIPLNNEGMAVVNNSDVTIPKLGALVLKGVLDDGKQMIAIISAGGMTYILKGTQLYDNRQRLVKGITGIINRDRVLMIAPDKTTKELKLHEK